MKNMKKKERRYRRSGNFIGVWNLVKLALVKFQELAGEQARIFRVHEGHLRLLEVVLLGEVVGVGECACAPLFLGDLEGLVLGFHLEDCRLPLHVGAYRVQVEFLDVVLEVLCGLLHAELRFRFADLREEHLVVRGSAVVDGDVDAERYGILPAVLELVAVCARLPRLEARAGVSPERYRDGTSLARDLGVLLRRANRDAVGLEARVLLLDRLLEVGERG